MKKKILYGVGIGVAALLLVAMSVLTIYSATVFSREKATSKKMTDSVRKFGEYTECEVYKDVPAMVYPETKIGQAADFGNKNYVIDVNGTTMEHYKDYVDLLVEQGYQKHSDNGEEGMEGRRGNH